MDGGVWVEVSDVRARLFLSFLAAIAIDHVAFVIDGCWVAVDDAALNASIFDILLLWLVAA